MFVRSENGNYKHYRSTNVRSLVPRPPHFGPVKFYKNGRLDRKWRYKYWELWFIETGEQLFWFRKNEESRYDGFEEKVWRFFWRKMEYLKKQRNKELRKRGL